MWRRLIVWFSLSFALLSASAWLTIRVTQVEGAAPFLMFISQGQVHDRPSPERTRLKEAQIFGVLRQDQGPESADASGGDQDYSVSYGTRKFGDAGASGTKDAPILWFFLPAQQSLILLINNAVPGVSGFQCKTSGPLPLDVTETRKAKNIGALARSRNADGGDRAIYYNFNIREAVQVDGVPINAIRMPPSEYPYTVYCHVRPHYQKVTFTRRAQDFIFLSPGNRHTIESASRAGILHVPAELFPGYTSVASIAATVTIKGTDQISFFGGRQDNSLENPEVTRVMRRGQSLTAEWADISLEQLRDVLLVIIGTLIAIGVTALIEGLRPIIDGRLLTSEIEIVRTSLIDQPGAADGT